MVETYQITSSVCMPILGLCPARELYSETHVAELLVQILSAVDYLHGRRVIHLDLKSDNMLVDDCNHLKIVDLGSAQLFTPGQPLNIEHIQGLSESRGTDPVRPAKKATHICAAVASSNDSTFDCSNRRPRQRYTAVHEGRCWTGTNSLVSSSPADPKLTNPKSFLPVNHYILFLPHLHSTIRTISSVHLCSQFILSFPKLRKSSKVTASALKLTFGPLECCRSSCKMGKLHR